MYYVTKEFNFDMAHMLDGHNGLCKNLHGHCYKVLVTLKSSNLDSMEMVLDFKNLKEIANEMFQLFDHACAINTASTDPFERELQNLLTKYDKKFIRLDFRTTAENMANYFYSYLSAKINPMVMQVSKVVVYETPTSYAEYKGDCICQKN